jgi:hypothetical protein
MATESHQFSNIAATTGAFGLFGGKYELAAAATWGGGNVQLEALAGDASTWLNVGSAITTNGVTVFDLAPGQYRLAVTTATSAYLALTTIPGEV